MQEENQPQEMVQSVARMTRDMRAAAANLSTEEARFLVDAYYTMQDRRIAAANQSRALDKSSEPHEILDWLRTQSTIIEDQVKAVLAKYVEGHIVGPWALGQMGIGPVIAAGIIARVDIKLAPTTGHIWRFAGLDPTQEWRKGERRPWNADLRRICWLLGESFVKLSPRFLAGEEACYYTGVFLKRKAREIVRNHSGDLSEQAISARTKKRFGEDTGAIKWLMGDLDKVGTTKQTKLSPWVRVETIVGGVRYAIDTDKKDNSDRILLLQNHMRMLGVETPDEGMVLDIRPFHELKPAELIPMLPPAHIHSRAKRYAVKLFLAHLHEIWFRLEFGKAPPNPYPIAHMGHSHKIDPPGLAMILADEEKRSKDIA